MRPTARLRPLVSRRLRALALALLLAAAAAPAGATEGIGRAATAAGRPNIIFVMTDQQFAGAMSCRMRERHLRTPAMDALAARGMLFTRAYTPDPLCMPARASIFTGRYPHRTRVTRNARPAGGFDPRELVSLGTYFRRAGYQSVYAGKWHLLYDRGDRDVHGFEILESRTGEGHDGRVTVAAARFLSAKHERPFLLVVSYLNPHNVCQWARRLSGRRQSLSCGEIGDPPGLEKLPPAPANLAPPRGEPDGMTSIRRAYQVPNGKFPVGEFTADDWRRVRWGYYRMVEKVDAEIGKLLAAARRAGLEESTLVVFTSDHGECAGAHRFNQKTVLYEESARVPLIIAWAGHTEAGISDRLVNTGLDLLPTMLEAAGIARPRGLRGRSLLPLALGRPAGPWRDQVVVETEMSQTGAVEGVRPVLRGRMVRTARYKYCLYDHGERRESLYDLAEDPGETVNLARDASHRKILLEHRARLETFAREEGDRLAASMLSGGVGPRPFPRAAGARRLRARAAKAAGRTGGSIQKN